MTKTEDLRTKTDDQLTAELTELKREQFNLRFQSATNQLENPARIREVRRTIAKIKTLQTERAKSAEAKAAEICASVGVDPLSIKPGSESQARDLRAEFEAIKDPARQMAFFRQHKDQLLSRK